GSERETGSGGIRLTNRPRLLTAPQISLLIRGGRTFFFYSAEASSDIARLVRAAPMPQSARSAAQDEALCVYALILVSNSQNWEKRNDPRNLELDQRDRFGAHRGRAGE